MELLEEQTENGIVIHVRSPRIDAAGAIVFKDRVKALTDGGDGRVVLNLEAVTFIDSSGLGAVVGAMKQLGPLRRLELAALSPGVAKVFRLTRMDSVFTIHDSLAAANQTLHTPS